MADEAGVMRIRVQAEAHDVMDDAFSSGLDYIIVIRKLAINLINLNKNFNKKCNMLSMVFALLMQ
jgi:hypothetical protein